MNGRNTRESAMKRVAEYSFAVDEARLYLDMHPNDEGAKRFYDKYNHLRKEAIKEYEKYYLYIFICNITFFNRM